MKDIPINAKVDCTDGPVGRSTGIVVNPVTRKVTHIAVRDKCLSGNDTRLVPFSKVAGATRERVSLNCRKADAKRASVGQAGRLRCHASAVDYVEADTIHLNVDRAAVEAMPELSVSRPNRLMGPGFLPWQERHSE